MKALILDGDGICNEDDHAPFSCDGDFYGQTAEHRAAVDAAVGCGELNGLYRFTATFHEGHCRRTLLRVGGERIVVREPGSYTFLLAKGVDYEFETEPFTTNVTYTMEDDASPFPLLRSQMLSSFGNWSEDIGDKLFSPQTPGMPGSCNWMPNFYGWPNVNYVFPGYEERFEAVLEDYAFNPLQVPYEWHSDDQNIVVASTNGIDANVVFREVPRWRKSKLTTTAQIGTNVLRSDLEFTYGTEEDPQPLFDITAPEVVFVNDDDRTSRYYRVTMTLDSPKYPAVATVAPVVAGDSAPRLFYDIKGESLPESELIELRTDRVKGRDEFVCFLSCTNIGQGTVSVVYRIDDDDAETLERQFEVIEPLQKLVCTDPVEGDGFYNPSCLVVGTNAWLKVGCRGNFNPEDVEWKVVSGPGRIVETNGYCALVEPTSQYDGDVVVEARFGHDSPIQPRFTMPVREKMRIPVVAYIVDDKHGKPSSTIHDIVGQLSYANKVFSQVGIEFFMDGLPYCITNKEYAEVNRCETIHKVDGSIEKLNRTSSQAISLFTMVPATNAIKLFYIGKIKGE